MHNITYTIEHVKGSKPARYKVMWGTIPFSPAMTKRDAEEYKQALENNTSVYGKWKGTNSRNTQHV